MTKDLTEQYDVLKHQNTKLCEQIENAEEILSQHEAYISSLQKENAKLNERIEKLEELLKECRNCLKVEYVYATSKTEEKILSDVLDKINKTIGEE